MGMGRDLERLCERIDQNSDQDAYMGEGSPLQAQGGTQEACVVEHAEEEPVHIYEDNFDSRNDFFVEELPLRVTFSRGDIADRDTDVAIRLAGDPWMDINTSY